MQAPSIPEVHAMLVRLGRGGAGTLRVNFAWGNIQPTSDSGYDWAEYDRVVAGAAKNGMRVLATVYSSPDWADPKPETPPLGQSLRQFQIFVAYLVGRYGTHGQFWSQHPDLPKTPITDWQLWNEPNSPLFWKPARDVSGYLTLLRAFHDVVKHVDPSARILLAGLFPTPRSGIPLERFPSAVYRRGAENLFDAVALHPYASTPRVALDRVAEMREVMDRVGDEGTAIWITEVGCASRGTPPGLVVGLQGQADYVRRTFELALANKGHLGVGGVIWFSLYDTPGPLWVGHCGLFDLNGTAKPAWDAFVQVAGGNA